MVQEELHCRNLFDFECLLSQHQDEDQVLAQEEELMLDHYIKYVYMVNCFMLV
jgi:hypothetical protein